MMSAEKYSNNHYTSITDNVVFQELLNQKYFKIGDSEVILLDLVLNDNDEDVMVYSYKSKDKEPVIGFALFTVSNIEKLFSNKMPIHYKMKMHLETLNKSLDLLGYNTLNEFVLELKEAQEEFPEYFI